MEPSRKIGAAVVAANPGMRAALQGEAAALALLAKLEPAQVGGGGWTARLECLGWSLV